jgi:putative flippase GtrA
LKLAWDFIRYNLVAGGSALVDWAVFLGARALGVHHLAGQGAARLAGGVFSFLMNRRNFADGTGHLVVQGRRFAGLYAFSFGLSLSLLALQVDLLGVPVVRAKLVADAVCFLTNFVVMRGYVFRPTAGLTHRVRTALRVFRRAA